MELKSFSFSCLLFFFLFLSFSSALDLSLSLNLSRTHRHPRRSEAEVKEMYENWLITYKKSYNSTIEKEMRYQIFKDNLRFVDKRNTAMNRTDKVTMNVLADLTVHEYESTRLGAKKPTNSTDDKCKKKGGGVNVVPKVVVHINKDLPTSVDWRDKGAVVPIKDQGSCESCWAFATIAAIESLNQIVTGGLVALSEQRLLDCDTENGNAGCNGGWPERAFEYIRDNDGIDWNWDYPYTAAQGWCKLNQGKYRVSINGYEHAPSEDENALMRVVARQPVVALIDASGRDFQLYTGGIYKADCGETHNHAVVIIGYGHDDNENMDYWLVRNSWGTGWGESGYIRMPRGVSSPKGKCAIAVGPTYPTKT